MFKIQYFFGAFHFGFFLVAVGISLKYSIFFCSMVCVLFWFWYRFPLHLWLKFKKNFFEIFNLFILLQVVHIYFFLSMIVIWASSNYSVSQTKLEFFFLQKWVLGIEFLHSEMFFILKKIDTYQEFILWNHHPDLNFSGKNSHNKLKLVQKL